MIKKSQVSPELITIRLNTLRGLLLSAPQLKMVKLLGKFKDLGKKVGE